MNTFLALLYLLALSLWVGGMAIFTFVVTPAIFRSFPRDRAGEIVGKLFPGYFVWPLALSALAMVLVFLLPADKSSAVFQWSLALVFAALLLNASVNINFYPKTVRIKQQVTSFETEPPDSPARKEFRRLHAISTIINLLVLACGAALLVLSRYLLGNC